MPTAGLLFIGLIALYIAASGKAQKILQALGAGVPDTSNQGTPDGTSDNPTNFDLLGANAALYNQFMNNPGSTNDIGDNSLYDTNYDIGPTGDDPTSIFGYFGGDPGGYLGPPDDPENLPGDRYLGFRSMIDSLGRYTNGPSKPPLISQSGGIGGFGYNGPPTVSQPGGIVRFGYLRPPVRG